VHGHDGGGRRCRDHADGDGGGWDEGPRGEGVECAGVGKEFEIGYKILEFGEGVGGRGGGVVGSLGALVVFGGDGVGKGVPGGKSAVDHD
jgi:hypothetical protein